MNPSPHPVDRQVVCVNENLETTVAWLFTGMPVKNGVYTIGALVWISDRNTEDVMLAVRLTELPPLKTAPPDSGFSLRHFRLLEDVKMSSSL